MDEFLDGLNKLGAFLSGKKTAIASVIGLACGVLHILDFEQIPDSYLMAGELIAAFIAGSGVTHKIVKRRAR